MNRKQLYDNCILCPRKCGAKRSAGQPGFCRMGSEMKISRAALHMWEEPCISGTAGSGAVFFSGCTLGCIYCQNYEISRGSVGRTYSPEELAGSFLSLQAQGANNINLVTPTHFLPGILDAIDIARNGGLKLPVLYNCSGYESLDCIKMLEGYVDIFLPDFKYADNTLAQSLSGCSDYKETALQAIKEMLRITGAPAFVKKCAEDQAASQRGATAAPNIIASGATTQLLDATYYNEHCDEEELLIKKGTIVRHLLLPGHIENSKEAIKLLYNELGDDIFISIMNQYTPLINDARFPELSRKVTEAEYEQVIDYAISLGIENAFIQEGDVAKESFIPDFDC